jgi:HAD superfamily hydrolase (TIGR01662 family)
VTTAAELLAERDHVLIDFDGPVCGLFGGHLSDGEAATRLKVLLGEGIPPDVAKAGDPFEVLRYAVSCGPATARTIETQLKRLELEAVATAAETPGIATTLAALHAAGCTVTVVSNNSVEAIRTFLVVHGLAAHVRGISARTRPDPELLKPNPFLVNEAIRSLGTSPRFCVMVGDSQADIDAAHAAGVAAIAYPTTERMAGADATIKEITELRS